MPRKRLQDRKADGAGPWKIDPDSDLSTGESVYYDFTELEYRGKKRHFRKYLPLSFAQISNESSEPLLVTYNGIFEDSVLPNSVESFDEQGIMSVEIKNVGSNNVAKEDISLTVKKDAYGADERAREQKSKPWIERALDDFIPGGIPGGR